MGLVRAEGSMNYRGREIVGLRTDEIAHLGLGYVPEDRQIFPTLTVRQNLELGLKRKGQFGRWTYEDMSSPICANASIMKLACFQVASNKCSPFAAHSWEIPILL
jgi:ABC-type lipopolysaccharide export system ATPase subunit